MRINPRDFRITGGRQVYLKKLPTNIRPFYRSRKQYRQLLAADVL